ncbi:myogenesis-regulating glycosidase-like isoform X2 [Penaeus indicus]|uniref:myogenesis-regulating glycosidase-like isoform X2 n=1 Tax=Penaeus indicus TaxID=29960 RepID=UPI00300D3482
MTERTGGGFLKESSTDFFKRSSSVEILTPTNGQLLARRPNISTSHLPEPVTKSKTKSEVAPELTPPDRQTSASTGTLALSSKNGAPMQNGTVSPRNQRSLENVRLGEKLPKPQRRKGAQLPPLHMPQANAPTPPNATPQGTPIIGERGHIFTISSAVPDDPISKNHPRKESGPDLNPFEKRRPSGKTPVTSPKEDEDEPVWQRRLSQLFVPPREDEFDHEKELQETTFLLPKDSPKLKPRRPATPTDEILPSDHAHKPSSSAHAHAEKGKSDRHDKAPEGKINFKDVRKKRKNKKIEEDDADRLSVLDKLESGRHDSTQRGVIGAQADNKSKASRASSQNSLSSLIRERMGKPDSPKSKTRADLGLMVLVVFLFIIIVVGISLTTYFYNLHLLELSIFSQIKFFEAPRILEIYNPDGKPVVKAHLGTWLPSDSIPEDCTHYLHYLQKHNRSITPGGLDKEEEEYDDMVCLDWTALARVQLRKLPSINDVQCYSVWWEAAREDFTLKDCLKVGGDEGAWWGGGEMSDGGYPVTNANVPPTQMVTGKLGRDSWGQLLRRTWLSEFSSLLSLPDSFKGHVSVNYENDGQICLESRPQPSISSRLPVLKYRLCTAQNLSAITYHLHTEALAQKKTAVQPLKNVLVRKPKVKEENITVSVNGSAPKDTRMEEAKARVRGRIDHPVWIPWMSSDQPLLTQDAILQYVDMVVNLTYGFKGHVLLPPSWQSQPGDLVFDPKRFPDPAVMARKIEEKGFKLALTIHPFVSVNAPTFEKGTLDGLWIRQRLSELPALTNYEDIYPSAVTDFSNPKAKHWFSVQLRKLKRMYNIDRFHLKPADSHDLPAYHEYHMPIPGPDAILSYFMESVSAVSPPISTEGAVMPPGAPTFLTLGISDGSWEGLETLVPRVLTLAMLGFPFIDVGPIGGVARMGHIPERELYIRWMEVATFLPAMQICVLPNKYDDEVRRLAEKYSKLRKTVVLPRLRKKIPEALEKGTPLITPLALFSPNDPVAAQVSDEWILGTDLLVAPITNRTQRTRNIYLPAGIWKDEIDGHLLRGGRWIKNYKLPLSEIAYFTFKSLHNDPA